MMKKTILAGTFILLAALVTSSSSAQRQEEIVSRHFLLKEEGLVSLNNPRGDISIQSWGKDYIEVIATSSNSACISPLAVSISSTTPLIFLITILPLVV